ncbi:MAG: hypothetical protein B7Z80_17755 [Rhodospirillales bacterium 20-64-7]|nr:MAG: hypothetical protein B7Z80_17755 [Rhodospirillales bacterium 20-64-7]
MVPCWYSRQRINRGHRSLTRSWISGGKPGRAPSATPKPRAASHARCARLTCGASIMPWATPSPATRPVTSNLLPMSSLAERIDQARVELSSWRCFAAEALLRWRHPTLGMVMPAEFIPLIEMTGLVREMTNWVLSRALAQLAKWHSEGLRLQICVNVSSRNLEEPDFVTRLADLLELNRIEPKFLELEFSDEHNFGNIAAVHKHLHDLRGLGVSIAIDDFGAGTNGFASIENLAADVIKLDRRLIRAMLDSPRQQAVVQTIIDMGHRLGMKVVAEGLENPATLKLLHGWGCEAAQGFLINRPMPAETFAEWLGRKFIA